MPFGIGIPELLIVLLAALLIFGPKRLPEMGRSLGRGMREFKDSISGINDDRVSELPAARDEKPAAREEEPVAAGSRERDTA
jgi:sec-independent protein translocase protein TatA